MAESAQGGGVWEFAVRWLTQRRPAKLVIDGVLAIVVGAFVSGVFASLIVSSGGFGPGAVSTKVWLSTLGTFGNTVATTAGWALVAVGCSRMIAETRSNIAGAAESQSARSTGFFGGRDGV